MRLAVVWGLLCCVGGCRERATLRQLPVNAVPVFASAPETTAMEGLAYRYAVSCTDADGDQLVLAPGPSEV